MAPVKVSSLDKLKVCTTLARAFCNGWLALILGRGPKGKGILRRFLYALIRSFLSNNTINGDVAIRKTTEERYLAVAKKVGFKSDTMVLPSGVRAHWIGDRGAERVLLYFHGGGYVLSAGPAHFHCLHRWAQEASPSKSTSVLVLGYTLAPAGQYPTQLRQASEALNFLLTEGGKRPSQIVIGGDSAGGNLTAALLGHLMHPHPEVQPVNLSEPLAGSLFISPWVKWVQTDRYYRNNKHLDIVGIATGRKWSRAVMGSAKNDNYTQPAAAGTAWYSNAPAAVSKIFVWAGSDEILLGSIIDYVDLLQASHSGVEFFVEEGAIHTDMYVDFECGYTKPTEGSAKIAHWLGST